MPGCVATLPRSRRVYIGTVHSKQEEHLPALLRAILQVMDKVLEHAVISAWPSQSGQRSASVLTSCKCTDISGSDGNQRVIWLCCVNSIRCLLREASFSYRLTSLQRWITIVLSTTKTFPIQKGKQTNKPVRLTWWLGELLQPGKPSYSDCHIHFARRLEAVWQDTMTAEQLLKLAADIPMDCSAVSSFNVSCQTNSSLLAKCMGSRCMTAFPGCKSSSYALSS